MRNSRGVWPDIYTYIHIYMHTYTLTLEEPTGEAKGGYNRTGEKRVGEERGGDERGAKRRREERTTNPHVKPNRYFSDLSFTLTDPPKTSGGQGESSENHRFDPDVRVGGKGREARPGSRAGSDGTLEERRGEERRGEDRRGERRRG